MRGVPQTMLLVEISGSYGGEYANVFLGAAPCSLLEYYEVSEVFATSITKPRLSLIINMTVTLLKIFLYFSCPSLQVKRYKNFK
jgi:hypothetical protein